MIIKKLTLTSFGKFTDKVIELNDSLNVIYGKNESGKSTVMNFIFAMFYGFGDNRKKGITFRDRCCPWSGEKAEGSMDIICDDGQSFTIYRKIGESGKKDIASVFDSITGKQISISPEELIGITSSTFSRTLYIKQASSLFSGSTEEIATRLSNMSHSGSTDLSLEGALKILDTMRRRIQLTRGSGGELSMINQQLLSLEKKKSLAATETEELSKMREKLEQARSELIEKKAYYNDCCCKDNADLPLRLSAQYTEKKRQLEGLLSDKEKKTNIYNASIQQYNTVKKFEDAPTSIPFSGYNHLIISITAIIIGIIAGICFSIHFYAVSAIGILNIFASLMKRRAFKKMLANKYGKCDLAYLFEKKQFAEKCSAFVSASKALYEKAVSDCGSAESEVKSLLTEFIKTYGCNPEEYDAAQHRFETEKKEAHIAIIALSERICILEAKLSASPVINKSELDNELSQLKQRHNELQTFLEAITLACSALCAANTKMQLNFAPMLNEKASEYFSFITDGKYNRIFSDEDMKINVEVNIPRNSELFSGGTVDQLYLSLRLALIDMIFESTKVPVICDQPLIQYDSNRRKNTFSLLKSLSAKRQLIIFTNDENIISDIPSPEILT